MTPIAPHVTAFFQKRLAIELRASRDTCDTSAYAFQLLFEFMSRRLGVAPADLALEALDAPLVLEFLEHLQKERHNSARTRNARLAAIRSFMRFVEYRVPSALDQIRRVRAIPAQRTDTRIVRHLTAGAPHKRQSCSSRVRSLAGTATFTCRWKPSRCACRGALERTHGASGSSPTRHTRAPARRPRATRPWIEALLMPAQWGDPSFRSCHSIWGDSRGDLYVVRLGTGVGTGSRGRRIVKHVRLR